MTPQRQRRALLWSTSTGSDAMKRFFIALSVWLALVGCGPAHAQMTMTGVGGGGFGGAAATYQGPGDIVSGATEWGSCARVYNASKASTATSLCDLVALTGGAAVCTLRGSTTGYVDLAASYCAGTTPSAACAAASGGACKVTKVYDQIGSTGGWIQATLSSMPTVTFSGANSLPGIDCTGGTNALLATAGTVSASQPFTYSVVYKSNSATGGGVSGGAGGGSDASIIAGNALFGLGTTSLSFSGAAANGSYHAAQALSATGANGSVVNIDSSETTATYGNTLTTASRICRNGSGGTSLDGIIMEIGLWATTGFDATQRGNMNTNQHSAVYGYNF